MVNGQSLQPSIGDEASPDSANICVLAQAGQYSHNVTATWEETCTSEVRENVCQAPELLVFKITSVDGDPIDLDVGFTVALQQFPTPRLLRIVPEAGSPMADLLDTEDWTDIPESLKLFHEDQSIPSVEESMEVLKHLKENARRLRHSIKQLERVIEIQRSHDAVALKDQLKQCSTVKCYIRTALHKARETISLLCVKFNSGHRQPHDEWQKFCNKSWAKNVATLCGPWRDPDQLHSQQGLGLGESSPGGPAGKAAWKAASQHAQDVAESHHRQPPHPHNSFGHRSRHPHHRRNLIIAALVLVSIFIFICRRRCSPRTRAERRWLNEARRNARSVRRAHRRQAIQAWFHKLVRSRRVRQDEEKGCLASAQEAVLEDAMQAEIRELRSAAEFVSALASAESDRSSPRPAPPERQPTRSSLPDYRSEAGYSEPPPNYDDDNDNLSDLSPVDGFQYRLMTPSGSMNTPDSSVIDTSRPSSRRSSAEVMVARKD